MTTSTDLASPTAREAREPSADRDRALVSVRGFARGDEMEMKNAVVGGAFAQRISVSRALVRAAIGARSVEVRQAGAGLVATAGGASIHQGGAQAIVSTGSVRVRQGGAGIAIGRSVSIDNGLVVFGITPRLEIQEGGRVLFGPLAALAIIGSVLGFAGVAAIVLRGVRGDRSRM